MDTLRMIPNDIWLAIGVAVIPCVILDVAINAIQQWQRQTAGVSVGGPGPVGAFLWSIFLNFVLASGFCFLYAALWPGSGRSYIYGAIVWLLLAIPFVVMANRMDDLQKKILTIRILGWLFKIGAATASLAFYIG
jgi:hypothetical protein